MRLMTYLGFSKPAVEALVDELITGASRLDLQTRLLQAIVSTEQIGTKREQLAGRQVLTAKTVLGDFIGWLGFIESPLEQRPDSRIERGAKLFQVPPVIVPGKLPQLPAQPWNTRATMWATGWWRWPRSLKTTPVTVPAEKSHRSRTRRWARCSPPCMRIGRNKSC